MTDLKKAELRQQKHSRLPVVAASSLAGTAVEWYDFFLYGTAAALVFNKLFFPTSDPLVGTMLALGTFAAGFLARPWAPSFWGTSAISTAVAPHWWPASCSWA